MPSVKNRRARQCRQTIEKNVINFKAHVNSVGFFVSVDRTVLLTSDGLKNIQRYPIEIAQSIACK